MAKPIRQYGSATRAAGTAANDDSPKPSSQAVDDFHTNSDVDTRPESQHHTLGGGTTQAAPGDHLHDGGTSSLLLGGVVLTGSRGGNAALPGIIAALVRLGAKDNTTV